MIPGTRVRLWERRGRYGQWDHDPKGEWVVSDWVSGSDYSGGLVSRSNYEEFLEQFADSEDTEWFQVVGDHGTYGVVIRFDADDRIPEMGEFFDSLENYPVINSERHSRLEMEAEDEAWHSYGRRDFVRWMGMLTMADDGPLTQNQWEDLIDKLTDEQVDHVWRDALRDGNGGEVTHHDTEGPTFHYDQALDGGVDLIEDLLRTTLGWAELLRNDLEELFTNVGTKQNAVRIRTMPAETVQAFFDYLVERTHTEVKDTDLFDPTPVLESVFKSTQKWSDEDWAVLFDVMEEEGAAAFDVGGVGRRLGRR